jgi:hypothetical protein
MNEWQSIDTAPRDGNTAILAISVPHQQAGLVVYNKQGEWEALSVGGTPLGVGFYPTHWLPIPRPPEDKRAKWHCSMCGQDVTEPCGRNCPHDSRSCAICGNHMTDRRLSRIGALTLLGCFLVLAYVAWLGAG